MAVPQLLAQAPMFLKFVVAQAGAEAIEVIVESAVDLGSDLAIEKVNEAINKAFPQFDDPNSVSSRFLQNVKMQTTVKAQARMMASSMNAQNKLIKKVDDYKDKVKNEKLAYKDTLKYKSINVLTGSKLNKKLDEKEEKAIKLASERINVSIQGNRTANSQVSAYTQGLGSTKLAYDNANDIGLELLASAMMKMINHSGHTTERGLSV